MLAGINRVVRVSGLIVAAVGVSVTSGVAAAQDPSGTGAEAPAVLGAPDGSPDGRSAGDAVPGEYLVTLKTPASGAARQQSGGGDLSSRIDAVMSRLNDTFGSPPEPIAGAATTPDDDPVLAELPIIDGFGARLSAGEAAILGTFDEVLSVEPNTLVKAESWPSASSAAGPDELPWGLDRIDQPDLPLNGTYDPPGDGSGVTAYVIDDGVWADHEEFEGRVIEPLINFGGDLGDTSDVDPYCMSHGTHVAGTIAGRNVGVAPGASIQGVRVLECAGFGSWMNIYRGMDWVAHNAKLPAVVNMSLGGAIHPSFVSAVRYLESKGIPVVVSAGNDAADACGSSPAFVPSAITVGASDIEDRPPWWSNFGPCVDLYAPGVNVLSASVGGPDRYIYANGTSMASPHVAGAAALYLSQHPTATPGAVERALVDGAAADVLNYLPLTSPNRLLQVNGLPDPIDKPDTAPVAYIKAPGGLRGVAVGKPITLDGRGSSDPSGGKLSYEWRLQGRPGVAGTKPTLTFTPTEIGLFMASLSVTNAAGVRDTAYLEVEVEDLNPPTVVLDPDGERLIADPGTKLSWDASASFDPDGGDLTYEWFYEIDGKVEVATGPTFAREFEGGFAQLTVRAKNEYGAYGGAQVNIAERRDPVAVVTPTSVRVKVGDSVRLDGSGSYAKNGPSGELSYRWQTDNPYDPPLSYEPTYTAFFDEVGTFEFVLTVTTWYSNETSTAKATVVVSDVDPPTPEGAAMTAMEPVRVLDTRLSSPLIPGPKGTLGAGGMVRLTVGDIPLTAAGVALNVTAVNPGGDGHLTVYPCGDRPNTSNVNYRAGVTSANAVVSLLGGQHELCVWSYAPSDVVVDVTGYLPGGSAAHSIEPVRAIDTRSSEGAGRVAAGGVVRVPVASAAKVPKNASAVFVNVTAANPSADGHLTVYPCGTVPDTSNVNYRAGVTKANMAAVRLAKNGSLCVKSHAETDVVVDVLGYVDADGGVELTSKRELDTRSSGLVASGNQQGRVPAGGTVKVKLDVDPAKTAGVFVNVVAVNPSGDGHLTVYPCGKPPTASVLNYQAGVTTSNMMFSKVDKTGSVCVSTFAATDVVIDYNGRVATPS